MANLPRIIIYIALLAATTLIPSTKLQSKHYVAIFKPAYDSRALIANEPPLSGSFALADTIAVAAPVTTTPVYAGVSNCGSDPNQILVYTRESGCSTTATNSQGCYGLGQDCNGIVRSLCGSDWTCQNNYFTNYMLSRYGSWAAAWQMELSSGWW